MPFAVSHCKCKMVKFYLRITAKMFIFQLVNLDYFLVKNAVSYTHLTLPTNREV